MSQKPDHDLLIEIAAQLKELRHQFSNHLKHHWAVTLTLVGALTMALIKILTG